MEINLDAGAVSSASEKLKSLSDSASSTASSVKGVHTVLWLDDALTNAFSNSLVAEIKTASKTLSDKQEQMGQYASLADTAAKGLVDADTGNIIGASVKFDPLGAMWTSFTGLIVCAWNWISGNGKDSSNSGSEWIDEMKQTAKDVVIAAEGAVTEENVSAEQNKYSTATDSITDEMRQEIWDYLMSIIGNEIGVAALLGNLEFESGGFNTMIVEGEKGNNIGYTEQVDAGEIKFQDGKGYGLAQWTYWSRKQGLLDYAKSKGGSVGNFFVQMEYLTTEWEFTTYSYPLTGKTTIQTLQEAADIRTAAEIIMKTYENCNSAYYDSIESRTFYAQKWLDRYGSK